MEILPVLKKNPYRFRRKIYKNYSQNLSKQIVKKKATFPRKKMATKTEVNKTNSTKNGNTRGHFLEKKKATLPQQRYQMKTMVTKTPEAMAGTVHGGNAPRQGALKD